MNEEKVVDIRGRFHEELSKIDYILRGLEKERVYGHNGNANKMDGSLHHNATKLRREISSLLTKIEYDRKSDSELIAETLADFEL